ncbi:MAG: transposase, partial [Clostridiaceae bacterium]|nr:transposase [Clostridiaceae bacterium]
MSFFGIGLENSIKNYSNLLISCNEEKTREEIEFICEKTNYESERKILVRNFKSEDIIKFIAAKMNVSKVYFHIKYSRKILKAKALTVVLMRSL